MTNDQTAPLSLVRATAWEVIHPTTGEIVDVPRLADAHLELEEAMRNLRYLADLSREIGYAKRELEERIAALAPGEASTERLVAGEHVAVLRTEPPSYEPAVLRRLYDDPELAPVSRQYLNIATVRPDLRKLKPLLSATVPEGEMGPVARFVGALREAQRPGRTKVSVERVGG